MPRGIEKIMKQSKQEIEDSEWIGYIYIYEDDKPTSVGGGSCDLDPLHRMFVRAT